MNTAWREAVTIKEKRAYPLQPAGRTWSRTEFEAVFEGHWERVYGVLYRLTGRPDEAEDLALEVFWRLWARPPRDRHNLVGWLYRVASNLGYNALRAAARRRSYEEEAGQWMLERRAAPSPEQETEQALERQRVRKVLAKMPSRQARLLILRHSGLSYRQIAEALQVAPSSVGKLLNRAETMFCRLYQKGADDAPEG